MLFRPLPVVALTLSLVVVLVSCSGRGGATISVSPSEVVLAPGESVVFTAVVVGGAGTEVTWSSSGGGLVPSGLTAVFTAPAEIGEYTVTARSAQDQGRWASAVVTVIATDDDGLVTDGWLQIPGARLYVGGDEYSDEVAVQPGSLVGVALDGSHYLVFVPPDADGTAVKLSDELTADSLGAFIAWRWATPEAAALRASAVQLSTGLRVVGLPSWGAVFEGDEVEFWNEKHRWAAVKPASGGPAAFIMPRGLVDINLAGVLNPKFGPLVDVAGEHSVVIDADVGFETFGSVVRAFAFTPASWTLQFKSSLPEAWASDPRLYAQLNAVDFLMTGLEAAEVSVGLIPFDDCWGLLFAPVFAAFEVGGLNLLQLKDESVDAFANRLADFAADAGLCAAIVLSAGKLEIAATIFSALSALEFAGRVTLGTWDTVLSSAYEGVQVGEWGVPPVVHRFDAEPLELLAGGLVTFSWLVTDDDGDELRCWVDPIGDGELFVGVGGECSGEQQFAIVYESAGVFLPRLVVEDQRGGTAEATAASTVIVRAPVAVSVVPATVSLPLDGTQPFSATVTGTSDMRVTWSVTCGSIGGSGNTITYTAPASVPSGETCTIRAISEADTSAWGEAVATITSSPPTQGYLAVTVTGLPPNVLANVTVTGPSNYYQTVTSSTTLTVPQGTYAVVAGAAGGLSGDDELFDPMPAEQTASIEVGETTHASVTYSPSVHVSIDPASVSVSVSGARDFTATVTGTSNTSVTWDATCGSINGDGNTVTYTAPATAGPCEVVVTSVADPTKSATATVTVTDGDFEPAPSYIDISNVILGAPSGGTRPVSFDISWDESWRGPDRPTWVVAHDNWDAAWVFVKYRVSGGPWQHATLAGSGHHQPVGSVVRVPSDRVGAFIYRSSSGYGAFTANGVGLQWDFTTDGVSAEASVEVRPFGIEMVYVPQGSFSLGSGGSSAGEFRSGGTTNTPFVITSQSSIVLGNDSGRLTWTEGEFSGTPSGSTDPAFPTGFGAFYAMKYPVMQGQYAEFLNTLTEQQENLHRQFRAEFRQAIEVMEDGTYASSLPYVPVTWLGWYNGAAFADWSGLRPMTELEYEKAARGVGSPVALEFAWGSTSIVAAIGLIDEGTVTEAPTPTTANSNYGNNVSPAGLVRAGGFVSPGMTREQAGVSYYGIGELSDNSGIATVTIGNAEGRTFTGLHGNGRLLETGLSDVPNWPSTHGVGAGRRGGSFQSPSSSLLISQRRSAAIGIVGRHSDLGFRGVRSAP